MSFYLAGLGGRCQHCGATYDEHKAYPQGERQSVQAFKKSVSQVSDKKLAAIRMIRAALELLEEI